MSLYGSRNLSSGTIEIANPFPKLLLTKQYDWLQYTSTASQGMHFALGRYTVPIMTLSNGNVGVNTLNPSSHFHVTGTGRFVYTNSNQMWLQNPTACNTNVSEPIEIYYDRTYSSNTAYSWTGHRAGKGCNYWYIRTHVGAQTGTDQLVVLPNGNVGVGVVAPVANLHVAGGIRTDAGRIWTGTDAVLDSVTGNFAVRKTDANNSNVWSPMVTYEATNAVTPCNFWVRGTLSVNSSNYAPARVTVDGPRLLIRNSNVGGGEARFWISNNGAGGLDWLVGQSNAASSDLRITRRTTATGAELHCASMTSNGDLIVGSNVLNPWGRLHVVTSNLGNVWVGDRSVSNVNMPCMLLASNNGVEGAVCWGESNYALYRSGTALRLMNNGTDRLVVGADSLARYMGPVRLFGCNIESNLGELQFGDSSNAWFRTNVDESLRVRTNNVDRMTVKSDGRIGVATTTPSELLDVWGSVCYGQGAADGVSYLRVNTLDAGNDKVLLTQDARNGSKIGHGQASNWTMDLYAGKRNTAQGGFTMNVGSAVEGWSRRLVVANNGNVCVGSNIAPPVKLLVEGEQWVDFVKASNNGSVVAPSYAWVSDPDTGLYLSNLGLIGVAVNGSNAMNVIAEAGSGRTSVEVTQDLILSKSQVRTFVKTLGGGVGDTAWVCSLNSGAGLAAFVEVVLTQSGSSAVGNSKAYKFPLKYNATGGAWQVLVPHGATSIDDGSDIDMDVRVVGGSATLRIRRSNAGVQTTGFTVMMTVWYPSNDALGVVASSTTESGAVAGATFIGSVIGSRDRRVGVNVVNPQATVHLRSSNYAGDGVDVYINRQTQSVMESYSPMAVGEEKWIWWGSNNANAASLKYVKTGASNLVSVGHTGNAAVVNVTDDGRVGVNTTAPKERLHVIGNALFTISNNDLFALSNNYARLQSGSGCNLVMHMTSPLSACNVTLGLTHGGDMAGQFGGYVKLEGSSEKLHIGQVKAGVESNCITVTRNDVPRVGINWVAPETSLHVNGDTTLMNNGSTVKLEGSNSGYTIRNVEAGRDMRVVTTGNLLVDKNTIGSTGVIFSASTGNMGIGVGNSQPGGRLQVRVTGNGKDYDTYMYKNNNRPFESYTETVIGEDVAMVFGRNGNMVQSGCVRYVHASGAADAASNQVQVGFSGRENILNVLSGGRVGVGTTAPSSMFDVEGDLEAMQMRASVDGAASNVSFGWWSESNTGWYRVGNGLIGRTCGGSLIESSSSSNVRVHNDSTFEQQVRLIVDESDSKVITTQRVTSALKNSGVWGPMATWGIMVDGVGNDNVQGMATDGSGNIYVLGYYTLGGTPMQVYNANGSASLTVSVRGTTNTTATFLVKYNSTGVAQWATSLDCNGGSGGRGIVVDSANNVWITGFYAGTPVYYDAGKNAVTNISLPGTSDNAGYLLKINGGSGDLVSAVVVNQISGDEKGLAVARDGNGNVYWSGYYGQGRSGQGLAIVYHISALNVTTSYTDLVRVANGTSASFVLKINTVGAIVNAVSLDTNALGYVQVGTLVVDDDYNVYVGGKYRGTMTIYDAGLSAAGAVASTVAPRVQDPSGPGVAFWVKISDEGRAVWATSLDANSEPTAIRIGKDGSVYCCGFYYSVSVANVYESDGGYSTRVALRATSGSASFLTKFNSSGRVQWAATIDGVADDYSSQMEIDGWDNLYVTGTYTNVATVYDSDGSASLVAPMRSGIGATAVSYLVKYSGVGKSVWSINVDSTSADSGISIKMDSVGNLLFSGTCNASPVIYNANDLTATNAASGVSLPVPTGMASFVVKYNSNFYSLGGALVDSVANGIQKILMNADDMLRPVYVAVVDALGNSRLIEVGPSSSKRLMWYSGKWRDV